MNLTVENPEARFSHVMAHMLWVFFNVNICISLCLRAPRKTDSSIGLPSLNKVVTYLLTYLLTDLNHGNVLNRFHVFYSDGYCEIAAAHVVSVFS